MNYGYSGFPYSGIGMGFGIIGVLGSLIFVVVFGIMIVALVKGVSQWNKNNQSPRLTVPATVVAKRTHVSHHHHHNTTGMHHSGSSTSYYVTFQVESGDRMELHVAGNDYGTFVEGDRGMLTFQGTRYLNFERKYEVEE